MGKLLLAAACLFLLQSASRADEPAADPIAAKITAAKDAFYAERDKADEALIKLLEKKEATAKQAGDLKTLEAVRAELEVFRNEGSLPKLVPLTIYDSSLKSARTKLENVYLGAIKTYTQKDKLDEAKALQKELDEFRAPKAVAEKPNADPLQPNSVWVAIENGAEVSRMTIKQRDKESFVAEVISTKLNSEKVVTGNIKEGKISWLAKDSKVVKGKAGANEEGELAKDPAGYVLNMTWRGTAGGGSGKYQFRLVK